ncbi:MAG: hypothetical protein IPF41_05990 [Flavobacteriales bacterium]|nr:hypothetical protein [Flavobacteriales bacterium]
MDPYAKLLSCALVPLAAEFVLPAMVAESAPAMGWTSAARGGIDATLQTAGNYMAEPEGGLRGALAKVNWVQSGASAGGVFNIGGTAVIGSSFNLSVRDGPQITFADKQFSERLAVSAAFGGLGKRMSSLISRQNANGITLGVTLRTTLSTTPTFGLLAGRATHFGLTQGISLSTTLPESYLNADK